MCDCLDKMNEHLAQFDAEVETRFLAPMDMSTSRTVPVIKTGRTRPGAKKKVPQIVANFCPWCGEEIKRVPKADAA